MARNDEARRRPRMPRAEPAGPAADETVRDDQPWGARAGDGGRRRPTAGALVLSLGAGAGLWFSAISTRDFAAHLDRQIHGIACSFAPGLVGSPDATGTSGCHATLMSPWSSFLRERVWGGVPISSVAMGTFAFLLAAIALVTLTGRQSDRRAALGLGAASLVPVGASLVWGSIAALELGAACKVCIGIYVSSAVVFLGAFALLRHAFRTSHPGPPTGWAALAGGAVALGLFVLAPAVTYVAAAPSHAKLVGACGTLDDPMPPPEVTVPLSLGSGPQALEVLDPLCPACRAFEGRLEASDAGGTLPRAGLLFPLDSACNWMVSESIHPGACLVSEAVLCAEAEADTVLGWAFANQAALLAIAQNDPAAVKKEILAAFPKLRGCVGSPAVRAKLNRGLRWAVDDELPVLTPQLYVDGRRLCDEDTDLGLDYALPRLVEAARKVPSSARAARTVPTDDGPARGEDR